MATFLTNLFEFLILHGEIMYICSVLLYGLFDLYKYEISMFVLDIANAYKRNECAFLEFVFVITTIIQTCTIIGLVNNIYVNQQEQQGNPECDFPMEFPYGENMNDNNTHNFN